MNDPLRILSLGAGVQSSCLYLAALQGEFEPLDAAIFADTHAEPAAVYTWLDFLEATGGNQIPLYRVSAGDLRQHTLASLGTQHTHTSQPPFYVRNPSPECEADASPEQQVTPDKGGMLWRKCTVDFKIAPIRRQMRALLQEHGLKRAEQWLGISADEAHRMKGSRVQYITNRYPLVERLWSRPDCLHWLREHDYPEPPKSACYFCPYHSHGHWARMKREDPVSFQLAVEFDEALRAGGRLPGVRGEVYLHRSFRPLREVDFDGTASGQLDLFSPGEECEGVCFV